jgi:hypothetical protein
MRMGCVMRWIIGFIEDEWGDVVEWGVVLGRG